MCIGTCLVSERARPQRFGSMLRVRHISSRVRRHTQVLGTWASMHILQRYSTRNPALEFACGQRVGSCQSPRGGDTRPKQSIASRFPCEGDDTRVEAKAESPRGTSLDEQNSHLGRWPPLHHGDRQSDPPSDLHLGFGTPCGCTLLPLPLRRTRQAAMRSSRRPLSRSPRGLMCTNSSGARACFSSS